MRHHPMQRTVFVLALAGPLFALVGPARAAGAFSASQSGAIASSGADEYPPEPGERWAEFHVFIGSDQTSLSEKSRVFRTVLADPRGRAPEVLVSLLAWCSATPPPAGRSNDDPSYLVHSLLMAAAEDPRWADAIAESREGREILALTAQGGVGSLQSRGVARDLIVALPMAPEEKSRLALMVVLSTHGFTPGYALAPVLNADDIATLRDAFEKSLDDIENFEPVEEWRGRPHFEAASVLAYLGDRASLPLFRRLETELPHRLAAHGRRYATMVELQHPPTRLLEVIDSDAALDPRRSGEAVWALRRAVELGVDQQAIVGALRRTFARVRERPDAQPSLVDLASVAMELGILTESDVPRKLRPPPPPSH